MHVFERKQIYITGKKSKRLVKIDRNLSVPLKHPGAKPCFLKATSTPPEMWKKTKREKLIDHTTTLPQLLPAVIFQGLAVSRSYTSNIPPLSFQEMSKEQLCSQTSQAWSILQPLRRHPQHPAPQAIRMQQAGGG